MMVNRGPQLVQEMNGCRNLRSCGSAISRRQSSQTATSGEASVRPAPSPVCSMVKPVPPRTGSSVSCTPSTSASGGASSTSRRPNASTASGSPSTSTCTPEGVFDTEPASPSSAAVT